VVMPAFVGSIAPGAKDDRYAKAMREQILTPESPLLIGLRLLESHIHGKAFAALPVEMGGLNTAVAAILGALAGIPFVDGDTIGRAKPELEMGPMRSTGFHWRPWPSATCGETAPSSPRRDLQVCRADCARPGVVGGGTVTVRCPVRGATLRKIAIGGTVSKAIAIGRAMREAQARGADVTEAVIGASGGVRLFDGRSPRSPGRTGRVHVGGVHAARDRAVGGPHAQDLAQERKRDLLAGRPALRDDPDLLCAVEAGSGKPFTNSTLREGLEMTVFASPPTRCGGHHKGWRLRARRTSASICRIDRWKRCSRMLASENRQ